MTTISQNNVNTLVPGLFGEQASLHSEAWKAQIEKLQARFGAAIVEVRMPGGDQPTEVPVVIVRKEEIVGVLRFAKEEPGFEYGFLADLTATDEGGDPRFEVVYNLLSHTHKRRIRFKARVGENEEIDTLVHVWKGANWAEREVWDMFGIKFSGHPDLRRILMDYRWQGHPLRKDYPLKGYQLFPTPEEPRPELLE